MKFNKLIILLCFLAIINCSNRQYNIEVFINTAIGQSIMQELSESLNIKNNFNLYKIEINKDDFVKIMHHLDLLISVTIDNLNNFDTVEMSNGLPYKKKYVSFESDLKIKINEVEDKSFAFKYIYDPTHPNAITKGIKKGYVAYPNINCELELELLFEYINLYKLFAKSFSVYEPNIKNNFEILDYYLEKYSKKDYSYKQSN